MAAKQSKTDEDLLKEAVYAIQDSYALRFFFRMILQRSGIDDPVAAGEVPTMMRELGKRDLGFEIRDLCLAVDPAFYAKLVGELNPESEESYE